MILSTQTDLTAQFFGLEAAVSMLAEAGFDAIDLSMFHGETTEWMFEPGFEARMKQVKEIALANGVYFNQAHAPFPTVKANDEAYNSMNIPKVIRAIEIAGMMEIRNLIVHPVAFPDHQKERNIEMYLSLAPYAKRAGVKIALENMWGRDSRRGVICKNVCSDGAELAEYADALPADLFTVCLDIGHVGLVGEYEYETIKTLGADRLTCVHIHDNDYLHDSHAAPFTMKLPWEQIAKGFSEIGYRGDLTLEADNFLNPLPKALYPSGLRFMHDCARHLIKMIESAEEDHKN